MQFRVVWMRRHCQLLFATTIWPIQCRQCVSQTNKPIYRRICMQNPSAKMHCTSLLILRYLSSYKVLCFTMAHFIIDNFISFSNGSSFKGILMVRHDMIALSTEVVCCSWSIHWNVVFWWISCICWNKNIRKYQPHLQMKIGYQCIEWRIQDSNCTLG